MKKTLSIVTPAYNRGEMLNRCFSSLNVQTDFDFEWIIVDDGSTDNTAEIAEGFSHAAFPVKYIRKHNGGKHTALNAAHPYIEGDYVLILDSDDYLVPTAVEQVKAGWEKYGQQKDVGVVIFLRGKTAEQPLCTAADENTPVDIMRYRRNAIVSNDACEVIRTELFLNYPFPEYAGERFISECALWNRVSFTHKCVYINSVIYLCEYLEGGLTKSGKRLRICNPRGGMFTSELRMDRKNYFSQRVKYGLLYTCYGCFAKLKPGEMIKNCRAKGLALLCMPFGWAIYQIWKKKY